MHTTSRQKLLLACIALVFLILAVASARTLLPWSDEAWFSSPALNLLTKGSPGVSLLDPTAGFRLNNLLRINEHSYWEPPLHTAAQVVWYKLVGFSVFHLRYLSILWGLVTLASWFFIMKILSEDIRPAILTVALLAVDFTFVWTASEGRMDMMAAALGQAGLASFLLLRERHFPLAILVSQALVAAAGMSHPMASGDFAGLLVLTLFYDRKRIRFTHVAIAAVPYVIGAAGWWLYISQDREAFFAQFGGNAADRFSSLSPGAFIQTQVRERFLWMFGLAPDTKGFSHLKIYILLVYLAGVIGFLVNRDLRRRPGYRALIAVWAASYVTFIAIDRESHFFYLIHFILLMVPMLSAWLVWCWDHRSLPRWALIAAMSCMVAIQIATNGRRIEQDAYDNVYLATTSYLKQHAVGKGIIMGSAELGFELGFDSDVVDDYRLGIRSGKKPTYIVIDRNRYEEWIPLLATQEPESYRQIRALLGQFHQVFDAGAYRIYARNDL
jgi:Dolichyl-phosphate-mannose-protein mannosyltransferase